MTCYEEYLWTFVNDPLRQDMMGHFKINKLPIKWVLVVGVVFPFLLTVFYRGSLGIPRPLGVTNQHPDRFRDRGPEEHNLDVQLAIRSGSRSRVQSSDEASDPSARTHPHPNVTGSSSSTNTTSHSSSDGRTYAADKKSVPNDIAGDMFVFSKHSLSSRNSSGMGNRTGSIVMRNADFLVEDIGAENPGAEEALLPPAQISAPSKDLSGYVSFLKSKEPLSINCSSCAFVSSSGQMRGTRAGELIDTHPCVIRMNNAPTMGFEKDVGRKTTVRFVAHSAIHGVHAKRDSQLKGEGLPKFLIVWGPPTKMVPNTKSYPYNTALKIAKDKAKEGLQVYLVSARQMEYADRTFERETGRNRMDSGSWLSTGFFTMLFARSICEEIHVFGMVSEDHCRIHPDSKVPYHYYDPRGPRECSMYKQHEHAKQRAHRFVTEKSLFSRWSKLDPKIDFKYPNWSADG